MFFQREIDRQLARQALEKLQQENQRKLDEDKKKDEELAAQAKKDDQPPPGPDSAGAKVAIVQAPVEPKPLAILNNQVPSFTDVTQSTAAVTQVVSRP